MNTSQQINNSVLVQPGSVVSKEIINKPTGTVTLFAFDKEQGLSEHTAPYDALVVVTQGLGEVTVDGTKNELKSGDMILMPANSRHAVKALEQFKMMLIMIRS